ncbi:MAG: hypothetical protein AAFQ51_04975 [Pseudomonadota bacterium]
MSDIAFIDVSQVPIVRYLGDYGVTDPVAAAVAGVAVLIVCVLILREHAQHQALASMRRYRVRNTDDARRINLIASRGHHLFSNTPKSRLRR